MATDKANSYPKIGRKIWFLLRARFAKTLPSSVGPEYIISTSDMTEASARSNVLNPFRDLKLIDENGKPTELAERWRHDDEYADVCKEIRGLIYPAPLIEAYPDGSTAQKESIKKWFMKNSKVGDVAGKMFADTYMLLSQGDLNASDSDTKVTSSSRSASTSATAKKSVVKKSASAAQPTDRAPAPAVDPHVIRKLPSVHIDVQVHISPDTTPEQIDRIFESMSKHLGSYIA
ncbi:hypothetical protein [Polaromonas sp. JS666]|uniref:hypothetical protein n=1 Tax=Polaromonas sp. (strain JS666 / ATCC BAA-500) TaxID=296591 RepID=UPI000053627A|nr:hypothetical protein [Polaromonas sp. JS666]ABE43469.1 hypothetical protein Bpro_1523 [Polaromonas sp. JS666]